ncbi:MAG: hypothetical protein Tsb009_30710 [Planctomycetaceae bacterium]
MTIGAVVQVTPLYDIKTRISDEMYTHLDDSTPFEFSIEGIIEDNSLFYGLYGPVISGPKRYDDCICSMIAFEGESNWNEISHCESYVIVGHSKVVRNQSYNPSDSKGFTTNGMPEYIQVSECRVMET